MRAGRTRTLPVACIVLFMTCTSVRNVYIVKDYDKNPAMVKRIAVHVRPDPKYPGLEPLIAHIAADAIRLQKNYLVYDIITDPVCAEKCSKYEGTAVFSVAEAALSGQNAVMEISGELYRNKHRELIWRASGKDTRKNTDPDLKNLTMVYVDKFGKAAENFAGPAFVILQDIVKTMPNPVLSDREVMEKINLEAFLFDDEANAALMCRISPAHLSDLYH